MKSNGLVVQAPVHDDSIGLTVFPSAPHWLSSALHSLNLLFIKVLPGQATVGRAHKLMCGQVWLSAKA